MLHIPSKSRGYIMQNMCPEGQDPCLCKSGVWGHVGVGGLPYPKRAQQAAPLQTAQAPTSDPPTSMTGGYPPLSVKKEADARRSEASLRSVLVRTRGCEAEATTQQTPLIDGSGQKSRGGYIPAPTSLHYYIKFQFRLFTVCLGNHPTTRRDRVMLHKIHPTHIK